MREPPAHAWFPPRLVPAEAHPGTGTALGPAVPYHAGMGLTATPVAVATPAVAPLVEALAEALALGVQVVALLVVGVLLVAFLALVRPRGPR